MTFRERIFTTLNNEKENDAACIAYNRTMAVLIVVSLIPLCFKESNIYLEIIEYVCIVVFITDYLLRWITADLSLHHGKLSFLLYPFTPMAIIDALSIMPGFIALNDSFKTLRILRLLRALRAFKLIRHSKSVRLLFDAFTRQRNQLLIVLVIACLYVVMCALVVFNVEPDTFDNIFDALYWSVVSLTTVGYGDLYPTSEIGRAIAMLSSLMGVAVVALPSSIITAGLLEEIREGDNNEQEIVT